MKYPSLKNTTLIVIDGRRASSALNLVLRGATVLLNEPVDCHILVMASTDAEEKRYEQFGEQAGLDFFFHAEKVTTSHEFTGRCAIANLVVLVGSSSTSIFEIESLEALGIPLIMSSQIIQELSPKQRTIVIRNDHTVIDISNILRGVLSKPVKH